MIEPSEPVPQTLQKQDLDGEQGRWSTQFNPSLQFGLGTAGGTASEAQSGPDHHLPVPRAEENKPVKLSSYVVDPTAAYENKQNWKSTLHASAGLVIDVLKESSDAFTPLKSVVGGLSAILKHYDVRYICSAKSLMSLTSRLASDGKSRDDRIVDTPGRRPCGIAKHPCS